MSPTEPFRPSHPVALWAVLTLALVLLSGCLVDSRHPIAEPDPAAADPDLLGTWGGQGEDGAYFFHVFQPTGSPPGMVEIVAVGFDKDLSGTVDRYCGFLSRVGKASYINLVGPVADSKAATGEPFFFVLYDELPNGELDFRLMREDVIRKAIGAGTLAGEKDASGGPTSHITAQPEQMRAFLLAADAAALWDKPMVVRRVTAQKP